MFSSKKRHCFYLISNNDFGLRFVLSSVFTMREDKNLNDYDTRPSLPLFFFSFFALEDFTCVSCWNFYVWTYIINLIIL